MKLMVVFPLTWLTVTLLASSYQCNYWADFKCALCCKIHQNDKLRLPIAFFGTTYAQTKVYSFLQSKSGGVGQIEQESADIVSSQNVRLANLRPHSWPIRST